MNPILSKHKFCINFMTKFLTFKTFILDLRQILDLRPFVNPAPVVLITTISTHRLWSVKKYNQKLLTTMLYFHKTFTGIPDKYKMYNIYLHTVG